MLLNSRLNGVNVFSNPTDKASNESAKDGEEEAKQKTRKTKPLLTFVWYVVF